MTREIVLPPTFDLGAGDYLLKPVSRDRLGRTLARIAPRPAMTPGIDRLCVREGQDRLLLPLPGVLYLRRDDDVTTVAWVNPKAISVGSLVAMACDEIVMARSSSMGDSQVIMGDLTGVKAVTEDLKAKA